MAEYIERERAIQKVKNVIATEWFRGNYEAIGPLQRVVDVQLGRMTAADVAPVVHGQWLNFYNDFSCAECDRCGTTFEVTDSESNEGLWNAFKLSYNYCPNCGAKMDEEEHDNV